MNKKLDFLRISIIMVITTALMAIASITIYGQITKPHFYEQFMTLGHKYLDEGKYSEAVLEFEKAIKIEPKTTEARLGVAEGSIELGDTPKAVKVLKEAQQIDLYNEDLLKDMLELLRDADPDAAYYILTTYVNAVGEDKISPSIRELLASANEPPQIPYVNPQSGIYIKPFTLKLQSDKIRIGHTFYYTTDGTTPDNTSEKYMGGIKIDKDTNIKFIGYNSAGETTEVFEMNYTLDPNAEKNVNDIIKRAKDKLNSTEEGTEVGNCVAGAKEEFSNAITTQEDMMKGDIITKEHASSVYMAVDAAIRVFESKIIVPTDRTALNNEVARANDLLRTAVEGSNVGQYRSGAKNTLQQVVDAETIVLDNILSRQADIDASTSRVTSAITSFQNKKITETDKIIADSGAKIGPVTVSLLWNTTDDLDLYVTSPRGDTIYFGNKNGSSGGHLDVDRQVTTFVANPVENIYWSNPPRGTYTVKVNVFNKRSSGYIPIKVRTVINGESKIYTLNLSSGTTTVTTFTY